MTDTTDPRRWHVTASRTVLRDRWIDVRADDCVTPGGQVLSPYYVLTYPDWAFIVALTPDRQLVMTRQYRHAVGTSLLELPGGAIDAKEDPEAGARRELREETGYVADQFEYLGWLFPNPATHTNRAHTFLARDARYVGGTSFDAGEDGMTVELVPLATMREQLTGGMVRQAMHVAALSMALKDGVLL